MNKYLIKVAEFHYRPVEVIALNEEDAKRLALEMLTDNKIKNQSVYSHTMSEEDWDVTHLETIKPVAPMNNTKIVVIEFNIRPKKEDCNLSFKPIAYECKENEPETEILKVSKIDDLLNCCLMDFDIEGFNQSSQMPVIYDRAIVRTNKSIEHWVNLFK